jgi:hypothetical protein
MEKILAKVTDVTVRERYYLQFGKHLPYQKMLQIKAIDFMYLMLYSSLF